MAHWDMPATYERDGQVYRFRGEWWCNGCNETWGTKELVDSDVCPDCGSEDLEMVYESTGS